MDQTSRNGRISQIDYDREMAFIAVSRDGDTPETLGVVRAISDPDHASAEFAILVRSDMKGKGLGVLLMKKIIRYCRERGIGQVVGEVLAANHRMLALARDLGFEILAGDEFQVQRVRLVFTGDSDRPTAPRAASRPGAG